MKPFLYAFLVSFCLVAAYLTYQHPCSRWEGTGTVGQYTISVCTEHK